MSTMSKVTFGASCVLSVFTIIGVYQYQDREREAIRLGPIRDAERLRLKAQDPQSSAADPVLTPQQEARRAEYELQKKLQEQYQQFQTIDQTKKTYGPESADKK